MRLIDADNLRGRMVNGNDKITIDCAPAIDPIHAAGGCYCRECRYWGEDGRCEPIKNGLIREYTRPTDFCSYGEPREEQGDDSH